MKKKSMILAGIVAAVVLCAVIVSACLPNFVERVYWEFRVLGKTPEETDEIMAKRGARLYGMFGKIYSVHDDRNITIYYGYEDERARLVLVFDGETRILDEFGQ